MSFPLSVHLNRGEAIRIARDERAQTMQQPSSIASRHLAPRATSVCRVCRLHRFRDIGRAAPRDGCPSLAGEWIDGVEPLTAGGVAPAAGDERLIAFDHVVPLIVEAEGGANETFAMGVSSKPVNSATDRDARQGQLIAIRQHRVERSIQARLIVGIDRRDFPAVRPSSRREYGNNA